jgi:hypothetical protein
MLAALIAGGAMAQTVSKPVVGKPPTAATGTTSLSTEAGVAGAAKSDASVFATMLENQKMLEKEARADRKLTGPDKTAELAAKGGKLQTDAKAIDAQQQEAKEKADAAMKAASNELTLGIVSGSAQAGSTTKDPGKQQTQPGAGQIKPCKDCLTTNKPH